MNFLKALWQNIVAPTKPQCDTPSQYVECPHCKAKHKNLSQFEQEHAEFSEGESSLHMVYKCGRCTVESLWFVDTGDLLYILSYGTTMEELREDVREHFRVWSGYSQASQVANLKYAINALRSNVNTLRCEDEWDQPQHAEIFKQGCAVDFVLYALLLSGQFDICRDNMRKFSMRTPCTEIETYAERLPRNLSVSYYKSLLDKASRQIVHLQDSYESAQNVEFVFIEPAIQQSASELFAIGMLMLQMQNKKQFHQLVYERLRHFVFMSV